MNNSFCKIYLSSDLKVGELLEQLVNVLGGVKGKFSLDTNVIEIDILENDECDISKSIQFPDGFLYFKYLVEISRRDQIDFDRFIEEIEKILIHFWEDGMPAVAACDFEKQLSFQGGYKSESLPWPK